MRVLIGMVAGAVVALGLAGDANAKNIKKENKFIESVAGKKLVSGNTWLIVTPGGKIEGVGRNNAKITGAWVWSQKFFCRNVVVGNKKFPEDCLTVSVDGNQVTFVRNKGKGDPVVYTVSE